MKTYKLFGIKVLEIFEDKTELPYQPKNPPKGAILSLSPEEIAEKEKQELLRKYNVD